MNKAAPKFIRPVHRCGIQVQWVQNDLNECCIIYLFCINAKKERDDNAIFPFRNVRWTPKEVNTCARPFSVRFGPARAARYYSRNTDKSDCVMINGRRGRSKGDGDSEVKLQVSPEYGEALLQRVWDLSPSWTNSPRLIKYGALILVTRRRQPKGERGFSRICRYVF